MLRRILPALAAVMLVGAGCSTSGSPTAVPSTTAAVTPGPTTAGPAASPSPAPTLATIGQPADDGARIVKVDTIDARTRDLTIESPVVGTVQARLLLPSTFADQPATKFPVLLLLHGGGGEYTDWTSKTDVAALTAPTDLLVAMPAALTSKMGDQIGTGTIQAPGVADLDKWDTFHNTELRQLLERNWQAGPKRAVAGLSMGGFGTVTYAEKHPELFEAVASFSGGPLDLKSLLGIQGNPDALGRWGKLAITALDWKTIDPVEAMPLLKGKALYFSYGNGQPGPLDPGRTDFDELEGIVGGGNVNFTAALADAGIPATVNAYGNGTHSWPYWERELHAALPMMLEAVGGTASGPLPTPPPPTPGPSASPNP
jgi:diacylglycerol O-acyltransferase / trehalose O-mycolyltransferase